MNELVIETAGVAFATFFATIGPLDVAAMYAALTSAVSRKRRRQMAVRGTLIAGSILLLFALVGDFLLAGLGISLAALRTGGGILLLLIGIDLVFARSSGSTSTTDEEEKEAQSKQDISVFPLATPLIAGPGALGRPRRVIGPVGNVDEAEAPDRRRGTTCSGGERGHHRVEER